MLVSPRALNHLPLIVPLQRYSMPITEAFCGDIGTVYCYCINDTCRCYWSTADASRQTRIKAFVAWAPFHMNPCNESTTIPKRKLLHGDPNPSDIINMFTGLLALKLTSHRTALCQFAILRLAIKVSGALSQSNSYSYSFVTIASSYSYS